MSDWTEITTCAVLAVLGLQMLHMWASGRRDHGVNVRFQELGDRVAVVENAIAEGQVNRASVVAFRAELASRIAHELAPQQAQLKLLDRKLDEIRSYLHELTEGTKGA